MLACTTISARAKRGRASWEPRRATSQKWCQLVSTTRSVLSTTHASKQGLGLGVESLAGRGLAPDGDEAREVPMLPSLLHRVRPRLQAVLHVARLRGSGGFLRHDLPC